MNICLGLDRLVIYVQTAYNLIQREVLSAVFPVILKDSSRSNIIHHIWQTNPDLVVRGFVDIHTDPNILLRIFDICQEFKVTHFAGLMITK